MSIGIRGGKSRSSQESGPTRTTRNRVRDVWNAAQGAAGAIPQPILQSQGTFGAGQTAGQAGLDALTGNPQAVQQFMSPYQQQVLDKLNQQFQNQNQMVTQGINDQATQAGAFGGSRHGIAQGVALGEAQRNQALQMAGLLNQGFEGAMGRAGMVAGLGQQAAGMGADLGMQAGSPDLWRMNILQRGMAGMPYQTYGRGRSSDLGFSAGFSKK